MVVNRIVSPISMGSNPIGHTNENTGCEPGDKSHNADVNAIGRHMGFKILFMWVRIPPSALMRAWQELVDAVDLKSTFF